MTTGEKIAKLRRKYNYTQEQFASLMNVSRQSVSKWEQDVSYPETEKLIKLCSLLHCSIDYLLRDEITDQNGLLEGSRNYRNARSLRGSNSFNEIKAKAPERLSDRRKQYDESDYNERENVLKLHHISKHFINNDKVTPVLYDIDLSFYENEFVAITGESGSGKTTLLNIISGVLGYDSGSISYYGKDYESFNSNDWQSFLSNDIGYVAQDNKLLMQYSVEQNVLSTLLIKGYTMESAEARIDNILSLVGLSDYKKEKIVKLSAGQRQRVAIARILAKEPKIILADEITANLDEATGDKILEVLKKVSSNHLVILITHNYDQAKKYITRHIEIRNKTVYLDEVITSNVCEVKTEDKMSDTALVLSNKKPNNTFVKWNIFSRIGLSAILIMLLFVSGLILFSLGDVFFMNSDNITIKKFDDTAFKNPDDTRIVITRKDKKEITNTDLETIQSIKNVRYVEKYDLVNDIKYYYRPQTDYEAYVTYSRAYIKPLATNYVKSSSCLKESQLYKGRLPQGLNEVVVSKGDADRLGEDMVIFFQLPYNRLGQDFFRTCKVVGVTYKSGDQLYLSEDECDMLSNLCTNSSVHLNYIYNAERNTYSRTIGIVPVIQDDVQNDDVFIDYQMLKMFSTVLPEGQCQISREYYDCFGLDEGKRNAVTVNAVQGLITDDRCNEYLRAVSNKLPVPVNTEPFVGVTKQTFYNIYDYGSYQMSAFIVDYIETDKVLEAIEETGLYDAISSYRLSMNEIDTDKKVNRQKICTVILISCLVLVFMTAFIASTLMGIKSCDFEIFKHIGINRRNRNCILFKQFAIYSITAYVLMSITIGILKIADFSYLHDYVKYFRLREFLICTIIYVVISIMTSLITCLHVNKKIGGRAFYDRN